jgi:hypothetical protein
MVGAIYSKKNIDKKLYDWSGTYISFFFFENRHVYFLLSKRCSIVANILNLLYLEFFYFTYIVISLWYATTLAGAL